ncbi:MAG: acyl-CoA thioesterase [Bacteroidetes bacterium]|nr:acyl-CoA thioesterase [Bacteroidota bacterium]
MNISADQFRHRFPLRVRFHHVDRMNVVHNLQYFYFFEEARIEYIRELGLPMDEQTFLSHDRFFIVRNVCDYFSPAMFDEQLTVLTRIMQVRNTSIMFEHVAVKADGTPAARAEHVFVHVDIEKNLPSRVPEHLRERIRIFEGENVDFIES